MKKKDIYTLGLLIALTLLTAFFSKNYEGANYITTVILGLSIIKFLLISFQFMELKKANVFWKILLIGYLTIFFIIVNILI